MLAGLGHAVSLQAHPQPLPGLRVGVGVPYLAPGQGSGAGSVAAVAGLALAEPAAADGPRHDRPAALDEFLVAPQVVVLQGDRGAAGLVADHVVVVVEHLQGARWAVERGGFDGALARACARRGERRGRSVWPSRRPDLGLARPRGPMGCVGRRLMGVGAARTWSVVGVVGVGVAHESD